MNNADSKLSLARLKVYKLQKRPKIKKELCDVVTAANVGNINGLLTHV